MSRSALPRVDFPAPELPTMAMRSMCPYRLETEYVFCYSVDV